MFLIGDSELIFFIQEKEQKTIISLALMTFDGCYTKLRFDLYGRLVRQDKEKDD